MKMPAVEVQKYRDRIPVTLNSKQDVDEQVRRLADTHGDGAVFVDGKSVAALKALDAQENEPLAGSSRHDHEILIEGNTVILADLVQKAFERSEVSRAEWNELPDAERELCIDQEIAFIRDPARATQTDAQVGDEEDAGK